jgi:EAL domain-containing protein (putative c-di-GMP-specific phosphodiesterase class I)
MEFALAWTMLLAMPPVLACAWLIAERRRVRESVARIEELTGSSTTGPIDHRLAACATALAERAPDERSTFHPRSGLPTREPLIEAIAASSAGTLGVVALTDHDRLATFDPALAERILMVVVERLARMIAGKRLVAHVDRGRFAIWFDVGVTPSEAAGEIAAIGYALGDTIVEERGEGRREIVPEIAVAHARWPEDGADPPALLARAVAALSLRQVTSTPMAVGVAADGARDRFLIEQDLRHAIERAEFLMQYQPLIDAAAGRVCGAEALIRWQHPMRGLVSPATFVPVVESMGLSDEVGLWTLNTAARQARAWQDQELGDLRVAVNVSAHQLERADMATLIARTLARHDLDAGALEIELTETVATTDTVRAAALFGELRAMGTHIAIDDFGTGFSSFSALRRLSFDKIKIDREFVTEVDDRRDSQAICRSIIALGQGLGIEVLAEGVERAEEYRWLRAAGCHLFQGFYFAPPMEADAFAAFVRDDDRLAALLGVRAPVGTIA